MSQGKRRTPEQIINCLREAEVLLSQGLSIPKSANGWAFRRKATIAIVRNMAVSKVNQAKRLKELEKENSRLRRAVSDLTLDKLILSESARGNF